MRALSETTDSQYRMFSSSPASQMLLIDDQQRTVGVSPTVAGASNHQPVGHLGFDLHRLA
jgi:hypothetical protein